MGEIVLFKPGAQRRAEENLVDFIALARKKLEVFGEDLDWGSDCWEMKGISTVSGRKKVLRVHWAHPIENTRDVYTPLLSGNDDFFKGWLRYTYGLSPKMNAVTDMTAVRYLDRALSRAPRSVVRLQPEDFNAAAAIARDRNADQTAYRVGVSLANIAAFLLENGLLACPFTWKNPLKRPASNDRIGPEREKNTERAMPRDGVLEALGDAYRRATEPMDVLALSVFVILLVAHARIAEIHRINIDGCEVEEQRDGKSYYGLRWWPAKGGVPEVRWIPTAFVDLTKDALRRIREVTASGRNLAQRYEAGLPVLPEATDDRGLIAVAALAAWGALPGALAGLVSRKVVPSLWKVGGFYRRSELEAAFRKDLPPDFPISDAKSGVRYAESLLTISKSIQPRHLGGRWRLETASSDLIVQTLCGHDGNKGVFERLDCRDAEGRIATLTPHQLRHLLTTLANEGNLSQLDISRWAGRKDPKHNKYYDHEMMDSIVATARARSPEMFGSAAVATPNGPISIADFIKGEKAGIHLTEFGVCRHDFSATPCPLYGDCLACVDHACVKGDARAELSLRGRLAVAEKAFADAQSATADGDYGAGIWEQRSRAELARLRMLVAILDDPAVPIGAVLSISDGEDGVPAVGAEATVSILAGESLNQARATEV